MAGTTTTDGDFFGLAGGLRSLVVNHNKAVDDLETLRGALQSGGVTAVTELMTDHATFKTAVDETKTLVDELHDDHAVVKTALDLIKAATGDGVLQIATLAISATAEDFKTTTVAYWRRLGIQFTKAATDNLSFTNADTINTGAASGTFWGVWLVQIGDTGTITTKSPSADQVYASEAAAIAALPAVDAGNVALGYITVNSSTDVDWVANTDDLTPASDCTDANFYDATVLSLASSLTSLSTLTASKPTAGPATLAASAPSGTAVDNANDLVAAKIGNAQGTAIAA